MSAYDQVKAGDRYVVPNFRDHGDTAERIVATDLKGEKWFAVNIETGGTAISPTTREGLLKELEAIDAWFPAAGIPIKHDGKWKDFTFVQLKDDTWLAYSYRGTVFRAASIEKLKERVEEYG